MERWTLFFSLALALVLSGCRIPAGGDSPQLKINSASQNVAINQCSSAVSLEISGIGGAISDSSAVINLSSEGGALTLYSDSACSSVISEITGISESAQFYFKGSGSGAFALTASSSAYGSASQEEIIVNQSCPPIACPLIMPNSAMLPICNFVPPPIDLNGCPTGCGTYNCPSPAPSSSPMPKPCPELIPVCPQPPPGCSYSLPPSTGCPTTCGTLVCTRFF